jgi:hypothetical protein
MIDLYEIRNGQEIKVAECTFKDVAQIGLFRFFRIQELLGRKMVHVPPKIFARRYPETVSKQGEVK